MKKSILFWTTIMLCLSCFAQENVKKGQTDHSINIGIKGGFNSSMYFVDKFKIMDVTIEEIQNNYKIGYFASVYMRVNINKHFFQPELHYTISKSEIMFDKRGSQSPEVQPDYATIDATIHSIGFPVLYGYNFVKRPPYAMCFFVGPKPMYVWKQKSKLSFSNFDQTGIEEKLFPINVSAVVGVGVTISNIFFDFSYEMGLHNISKSVRYDNMSPEGEEQISNVTFNRRNNILSFSLGVIF